MGFNIHHSLSSIFPGTEDDGFTNPFNHSLCNYLPGAWYVSGAVLGPKGRWTRPTFQWSLRSSGSEWGLCLLPTKSFCLSGLERKRAGDTGVLRDKYFSEAIPLTVRVCPGGSLKCEICCESTTSSIGSVPIDLSQWSFSNFFSMILWDFQGQFRLQDFALYFGTILTHSLRWNQRMCPVYRPMINPQVWQLRVREREWKWRKRQQTNKLSCMPMYSSIP